MRRILCFAMHTASLEGVKLETGRIHARDVRAMSFVTRDAHVGV